jgi:large subunit ribosomal protein L17
MVTSLFEHERITTTVPKAREARRVAEKLITKAKRGDLHSRRLVASYVRDENVVRKLFDTIAPWYEDRPGGYTRIRKIGNRLGDGGEIGLLELVKTGELLDQDLKDQEERAQKRLARKEARTQARAEAQAAATGGAALPDDDDDDEDDEDDKK